jgi:hypothetical protein
MKKLTNTIFVASMAILMVSGIVVLTPRAVHAAHAVAATLVQDVDNPARDTFQAVFPAECTGSAFPWAPCTGMTIPTTNGSGEAVSMLVIEYIAGHCDVTAPFELSFTDYTPTEQQTLFPGDTIMPVSSTAGKFVQFLVTDANGNFAQPTRIYAAAGTQLLSGAANIPCSFSISGHLVTP